MKKSLDSDFLEQPGHCLSDLLVQFLLESSGGKTIQTKDGHKIVSTKLFARPVEISNKDDACLDEAIHNRYFYRYSFQINQTLDMNIQNQLATRLQEEYCIKDRYEYLLENKISILQEIVEDCKSEAERITEKLVELLAQNFHEHLEIKRSINDIKYHEKHCVILLGNTGVGKSTIACYLSNTTESDTFKVSHTSVVTTNDVHHKEVKVFRGTESESLFNTTLQILDCPGLGNTAKDKDGNKLTDDHVLKLISNSIRINCRKDMKYHNQDDVIFGRKDKYCNYNWLY